MARYSMSFKLAALARLEEEGGIGALALELGVHRVQLYRWRRAFESGGHAARLGCGVLA